LIVIGLALFLYSVLFSPRPVKELRLLTWRRYSHDQTTV
jgi:hypothetical protein